MATAGKGGKEGPSSSYYDDNCVEFAVRLNGRGQVRSESREDVAAVTGGG